MSDVPAVRGRTTDWRTLLGLALALLVPSLPLSEWSHEFASTAHLVGYEVLWWSMVAVILVYVRAVEHRPFSSIGFCAPRGRDVPAAIFMAAAMIVGIAVVYRLVMPLLHADESAPVNNLLGTPGWWLAASTIRAGVAEEILFRGYAIERTQELTRSRWLGAILPCAIFALAHVASWGWAHLLPAGFGGVALTLLYVWRRNLWANILAHILVDGSLIALS
jgi:membrane protease YdiL (CAAX protease family)